VITPEQCRKAFWSAAEELLGDETVHDMEKPYFDAEMDMVDTSGGGMPSRFFELFAEALEASL
jgi:hypothetical protein